MGKAWSIRRILLLITGGLTLMIALLCARDVDTNVRRWMDVHALRDASNLGDQLFDATEKLSIERDVALSMLLAPDADAIADLKPRLGESRQATDRALGDAMAALEQYKFNELSTFRNDVKQRRAAISELRLQIDHILADPKHAGAREVSVRWSAEVSALTGETEALWLGFVKHFIAIDPIVTQQLRYKHALRTITEYTGRERSLIGQIISENRDPTQEQVSQLLRGEGVTDLSWRTARILAEQAGLYDAIAPAYMDAESHFATMHSMIQGMFYVPGARHGVTYPISADLWFELSDQALESLRALQSASVVQTQAHLDGLLQEAEREITVRAAIFLLALLLCGYSFWMVVARVTRPIDQIVDALVRATRGESVDFKAPSRRIDEIGKLGDVLTAFQQNLENVQRTALELESSESRLRSVVDHAMDGLITLDAQGIVQSFNPACERFFGHAATDIIGAHVSTLMPELLTGEKKNLPDYLGASAETGGRRKDATTFPIELSLSAFALEGRTYYSGIVRDITVRKRAERELLRHTEALERSNKELDDFAYIASHDLKEPLRGIHNHARFLLEDNSDKLDAESVKRLDRLVHLSQRMEKLINDLLYFSRLGRQDLAVQSTDLNVIVQDIIGTLDHFLEERNAQIVIPAPLPTIVCDRPRVSELVRNLMTNAVKHNDKPEKIVEIGFLPARTAPTGEYLRNVFFVKDNGVGIDPEFHTEVFRIFRRLKPNQGPDDGNGVGLTFVKKIVERHGGSIWVESQPGEGAAFYFTLEMAKDDTRLGAKAA